MPVVTCTLIEGYSAETRTMLEERLTDTVCAAIGAPAEVTTIILNEVSSDNYMRGRTHRTPATTPSPPSEIVRDFLNAMEKRDLGGAGGFLDNNFKMIFPGGATFTKLEQLIDWAKDRYTSVGKTYDRFDEAYGTDGATVYCYGTLHGVWLDGTKFEGIRFIDRFTVKDGKLVDQMVWNDFGQK